MPLESSAGTSENDLWARTSQLQLTQKVKGKPPENWFSLQPAHMSLDWG